MQAKVWFSMQKRNDKLNKTWLINELGTIVKTPTQIIAYF